MGQGVQPELTNLQTQPSKEITERERERADYREPIEQLQAALERAQEDHNRVTLVLENQAERGGKLREVVHRLRTELADIRRKLGKKPLTNC